MLTSYMTLWLSKYPYHSRKKKSVIQCYVLRVTHITSNLLVWQWFFSLSSILPGNKINRRYIILRHGRDTLCAFNVPLYTYFFFLSNVLTFSKYDAFYHVTKNTHINQASPRETSYEVVRYVKGKNIHKRTSKSFFEYTSSQTQQSYYFVKGHPHPSFCVGSHTPILMHLTYCCSLQYFVQKNLTG